MANYCDTALLEERWYLWLLASATPELEEYRKMGILYTKPGVHVEDDGKLLYDKNGRPLLDPSSKLKHHCLSLKTPIRFNTCEGQVSEFIIQSSLVSVNTFSLKEINNYISLDSAEESINGSEDLSLISNWYIREIPEPMAWHGLVGDIEKMCNGIAQKFKPKTEEEHAELSHEAILQVLQKLKNGKLKYTPGKAPVFNLLTTTIYRCLFSVMNKRKHTREGQLKLVAAIQNGSVPVNCLSYKLHKQFITS